jgi:hypothetical protein
MDRPNKLEISSFPDDLRRRFKAATARNGKSMSEVAVDLVTVYCNEQEAVARAVEEEADASRARS